MKTKKKIDLITKNISKMEFYDPGHLGHPGQMTENTWKHDENDEKHRLNRQNHCPGSCPGSRRPETDVRITKNEAKIRDLRSMTKTCLRLNKIRTSVTDQLMPTHLMWNTLMTPSIPDQLVLNIMRTHLISDRNSNCQKLNLTFFFF